MTIRNRTIVFDLQPDEPQEKFFLNATSQFITPEANVQAGVKMVSCYEDQSGPKNAHVVDYINTNRSKDMSVLL